MSKENKSILNKSVKKIAAAFLMGMLILTGTVSVFAAPEVYSTATPDQWMPQKYTGFAYNHNPMDDPKAAKDIIVDENAIYGFSPNPKSDRLGEFASYDFGDPLTVWKARQDRLKYLSQDAGLYAYLMQLRSEGRSTEETAREISRLRNVLRLQAYEDDPVGLAKVKASNLKTYGNEEGPTADSLYKKYGSWETVLQKAFSTNHGMDACLGLYDDNYPRYMMIQTP